MGGISPNPLCYRVFGRADEIARVMGSEHARAEHLFLAIIHEDRTVPARQLATFVDLDRAEAAVREAAGQYGHPSSARPPRPEFAGFMVAHEMGDSYIGAEHLFLGLIRDRQGVPARALAGLVDLDQVEAAVLDVVNSPGYRVPRCPEDGLLLPAGQELDEPLRMAIIESLPDGATFGFNWEDGRPWIRVTGPGNNRDVLNAALARLGRPGLD